MRDDFLTSTGVVFREHQVRKIMREQVDLRYQKIVRVAPQANSKRCLIQRQQCVVKFLNLFQTKRRVISLDESWLDSVRYQRRCW